MAPLNLKLCTHIIYLLLHYSYIVYVLFVSDTNLDCNMVHVPYVRYHNTVTLGNPGKKSSRTVTNQPGKMAENRISLINAGLEKTPGQNCQILNKRQGHLIEKIP